MKIQREWVTPITTGAFLLVGVTGILMFFHADSGANKFVHEWLSWVLVGGAILHLTVNFAALKRHLLTRRGQVLLGAFVLALAVSFVPIGNRKESPFVPSIRALSQAPLATLAQVAQISPEQLRDHLSRAGYPSASDKQSLSELVGADTGKQMRVLAGVFDAGK
jgi:hypothetical protein